MMLLRTSAEAGIHTLSRFMTLGLRYRLRASIMHVPIWMQAEGEIACLTAHDVDELRAVIAAQGRHIESLQAQLQRQHEQLQRQQAELQQRKVEAEQAAAVIAEQQRQLEKMETEIVAAAAVNEQQKKLVQEQKARTTQLEEELEKCVMKTI